MVIEVREYLDEQGRSPFGRWFERLSAPAAARVTTAVARIALGNVSGLKSVGEGVLEHRIDFGPGYRLYLGRDGGTLVILLAGGTKARQSKDIAMAKALWAHYRQRKKGGH